MRINNNKIETSKSVKLLEVEIHYQIINFNEHISTLCSKAAIQLSALYRLQRQMTKTEKTCDNK